MPNMKVVTELGAELLETSAGKTALSAAARLGEEAASLLSKAPRLEKATTAVDNAITNAGEKGAAKEIGSAALASVARDGNATRTLQEFITTLKERPTSTEGALAKEKLAAMDSWTPGLKSVDVSDGKALIHPTANIHSLNSIENGAVVGPGAVVEGTAPIGAWNQTKMKGFLDSGAVVKEGAWVGEHTFVGPNISIGSEAKVGMLSKIHGHIGADADIAPEVTIGKGASVGESARIEQGATILGKVEQYARVEAEATVPKKVTVYEGETVKKGTVAERDWEAELTGDPPHDEWLYQKSNGLPKDIEDLD